MKKISLFFVVLIALFAFAACDKSNDPANHFTYEGKDYMIDSTLLIEWVLNNGTPDQQSVFQFMFRSIDGTDTTGFLVAVYDDVSNTLGGNYPSVYQIDLQNSSRAIIPEGVFCGSGILLPDGFGFYTGEGGSVDISVTDGDYNIDFNDISVGIYNENMDAYEETSKVSGVFKGNLVKYTFPLEKKSAFNYPLLEKFIRLRVKK